MKIFYKTTILLIFISQSHFTNAAFVSNNIQNDLYQSRATAIGDVNNDGNLDIYVGNQLEQNKLWLGNGEGAFTSADIPGDDTGNTTDVVMADFNTDDILDLYVTNWYGKNKLWLGGDDGSFTNADIPSDGTNTNAVAAATGDVDNDGDIDIYVGIYSGGSNQLWLNDGNGNFTANHLSGDLSADDVTMADFNGDGNLDLFTSKGRQNTQVKLWLGNGDATFTEKVIPLASNCSDPSGGCLGRTVNAGDIDGDGDIDLYMTSWYEWNLNKIWLNDGSANFTETNISEDYGLSAIDSKMIDIDSDGDLDIVIASFSTSYKDHIWKNDGFGNFIKEYFTDKAEWSYGVSTGDINNDGEIDIYIANGNNSDLQNRLWLQDNQAPVLTLNGNEIEIVEVGTAYTDSGASCRDNIDTNCHVIKGGSVDINTVGAYTLTYVASDLAGNESTQINRTVEVVDTTIPVITLKSSSSLQVFINDTFTDPGYNCTDNYDISCSVIVSGIIDTSIIGTYSLSYNAVDSSGNNAVQVIRTIDVIKKPSKGSSKHVSKAILDIIFESTEVKKKNVITETNSETKNEEIVSDTNNGKCEASLHLTQNLKVGAKDGNYHTYTNDIVKEVMILQYHLNRLGFNTGAVDGILGPITDAAIKRLQISLGTNADGYVGPKTRLLINKSC